ncbi:KRAB-A domain-containing protein 2 [Trichonephila clavipes]|uniref:KRAB-A domain-containing protein 2 n=1 Tax=Trichonephila clavipes TaxID=2585209 RepID=A0A8X6V6T5_TRICX|nr:KRAB-A domain-containing protein 2 [Trichonephila clavipes]
MCSDIEKNQTLAELVSEEQFNEIIGMFLNKRLDKAKSLWTRERIEEAIADIERFKLAPLLKLKRTHKQYYYGKKYNIYIMEVGCPRTLQSDNGREFTAAVIQELKNLWPTCKIVNGRLRHPASQRSVERSNQDVEAMLRAWLQHGQYHKKLGSKLLLCSVPKEFLFS